MEEDTAAYSMTKIQDGRRYCSIFYDKVTGWKKILQHIL
jgi:hypothetical protein